jgi:hypothetical protein
VLDWQIIEPRFGCVFGLLCYSPAYDLEPPGGDEDIDICDLQYVYGRMGSTCANPFPPH